MYNLQIMYRNKPICSEFYFKSSHFWGTVHNCSHMGPMGSSSELQGLSKKVDLAHRKQSENIFYPIFLKKYRVKKLSFFKKWPYFSLEM